MSEWRSWNNFSFEVSLNSFTDGSRDWIRCGGRPASLTNCLFCSLFSVLPDLHFCHPRFAPHQMRDIASRVATWVRCVCWEKFPHPEGPSVITTWASFPTEPPPNRRGAVCICLVACGTSTPVSAIFPLPFFFRVALWFCPRVSSMEGTVCALSTMLTYCAVQG